MSNPSIFRLKQEQSDIIDALMENEGLLTPEIQAALDMNKTNFLEKAERVSFIVRKLNADIETIDGEIERLQALKKKSQKSKETLDNFLTYAVENFGETITKSKAKYPPKVIRLTLGDIQVAYSEKLDQSNLNFSTVQEVPVALRAFANIVFKEKFDLERASIVVNALKQNLPYDISFDNKNIATVLKIADKVKEEIPLTEEETEIWEKYKDVSNHASMKLDSKVKL